MTEPKPSRIAIVGTGMVGATTAYTLLLRQRVTELVLIDANRDKALGDALDMNHGLPFVGQTKIWAGDYPDCADADIVIIAAGAAQKPGETRLDLLKRNAGILEDIIERVTAHNRNGILLVATNPVDILAYLCWKKSGWPARRVIGSGTLLDSARFRYLIGQALRIDPRHVHAHIVGEHGDSEVPLWSTANVAGKTVELSEAERRRIFEQTRDAAYEIIRAKGATYYAIALALDRICAAILRDEAAVLPVSTLADGYRGISDVYLGLPCVVDRTGVREIIDLPMTAEEEALLKASAAKLRERIDEMLA